ncbi:hydrophobe/amphiphile efflux-1 family RND transporter [Niveispirillum lacus]|uniref:Efflux pump membrane transporter n=1 Tax=Niveispirillum lacus TaxID=1981099 RepID=A0A255Z7L0_9PROT|nr:efflux RND transporter permease subunit [Niveispirillum lacus]OYQ37411.1 hydrophobe/amphiphile efflux-1 family RND transporter [Niveispirillum lacus]
MAKFFIDRPVFAWVIAIVIMLAGALSIMRLPIEQYPAIAPPSIAVTASYPGASAETLEKTVTQVIEQNLKGIDNLRYLSSSSDASGSVTITLTFNAGTDPDIAQVQVQNKVTPALSSLPSEVQQRGVVVSKSAASFLMVAGFVSRDGRLDGNDLGDFVASRVQDPISRVNGVGSVQVFGGGYAMRIWLDPIKMAGFGITVDEVSAAIRAQNAQVSAGQVGGTPSVKGQQLNATVTAQSRLQTPEQFRTILLKSARNGSAVHLGDVARVELGGESYDFVSRYNRLNAVGLAVNLATGANALETAAAVKQAIETLRPSFPAGVDIEYPYETTPFVKLSIQEVVKTLAEAVVLVFLVMYLFLQSLRATLIPTIAVPVVLLGTFGILSAFGFSINTLTLFGVVLAIGLLVDDAIVVVENVERVMAEEGLSPREATRKSMEQITGALVGIGLVLSAVFVPMAFFPGSTGVIYRQFSITIVSAMVLSVLVALILTPALCASLLKPQDHNDRRGFFGWFNRNFNRANERYVTATGGVLRRSKRFLLVFAGLVAILAFLFMRLPTAFLPEEDQGIVFAMVMAPPGSTQERTMQTVKQVEDYLLTQEAAHIEGVFSVGGFSFAGSGQNSAMIFIRLKDWSQRHGADATAQAIAMRSMGAFMGLKDAMVFAFTPPAVMELGNATGFDFQLLDEAGAGHEALLAARNQFLGMAAQHPALAGVRPNGLEDTAQLRVDVDKQKAAALGLEIADINNTLTTFWGSTYVDDFVDRGRVKRVFVQADAPFRMLPDDIGKLHVRNNQGEMVPFSAFATAHWSYGPPKLERFMGTSSMNIQGQPAPGYSSGEAMAAVEQLVAQLPPGVGLAWTGLSYEERLSGSQAPALYAISLLVVFLCLAALYESWSIPLAVMLVVPLGVLGAVVAATLTGMSNDIYFQVGLLTTIGLSAKNAILIVEFAKEYYEKGMGLMEATLEAARQRLRPIVMTSLAFILGVMPLALASGAGSGSQNAIGIGVVGGMLSATVLAIFFVPIFFVGVEKLVMRFSPKKPDAGRE